MYNRMNNNDIEVLRGIVGADCVFTGESINPDYGHDELGGITHMPEALVRVHTTEEISAVMKHAYAREIPVTVRGSGTGLVGAAVPVCSGILLETTKMNKILEINPQNMTAKVQPGVILGHLKNEVEKQGFLWGITDLEDAEKNSGQYKLKANIVEQC